MTVYSVNLGIGWASSGVEYAQAYRAQAFRQIKMPAKFIFSDMILGNNIEDMTSNLGFADNQIIWLYNFFTDVKIAPSTYHLTQLEDSLHFRKRDYIKEEVANREVHYTFKTEQLVIVARYKDYDQQTIDQVSYLFNGQMVRRDFYSYVKYASEMYLGSSKNNHVSFREFYNEDGTLAYRQHLSKDNEQYEFPGGKIFYSKNDLYREMLKQLNFSARDVIILDRLDEDKQLVNSQLIFENHQAAKLVVVVHADHYDKHYTNQQQILWNNFYEYQFTHPQEIAAYIVATDKQRDLLVQQEKKFQHANPSVITIPVGSLEELKHSHGQRKKHSLITASRLATEKHLDWLIEATVQAHQQISDISLDIYGQGNQLARLQKLIKDNHAENYIRLMGQHDLTNTYINYDAYIAASTSEGFGLSLLEAVGSGLPMVGFDVPYGNQTFIDNEKNGYLLPYMEDWNTAKKVQTLSTGIIKLFQHQNLTAFSEHSYELAEPYLTSKVSQSWGKLLEELQNA